MSRTHYESTAEIEARIDFFVAKRDRNLKWAEWLESASKWLKHIGSVDGVPKLFKDAEEAEAEAAKLRSAAEHEDTVTLPKLKAKLAEMTTAPLVGVGDNTVARK